MIMSAKILFYVPNLIDYARFVFLIYAWYNIDMPEVFLIFYSIQAILDYFDGYFARILKQTSTFGSWLDVIIDNLGRGIIYCHVNQAFYLITCIEWVTFSCTHSFGAFWKEIFSSLKNVPFFVEKVMANGFKTKTGFLSILGLHCLPIWLYVHKSYPGCLAEYQVLFYAILGTLCLGRILCVSVELWIIYKHIHKMIISDDLDAESKK